MSARDRRRSRSVLIALVILALLAAEAFGDSPLRWSVPLKVVAATAVWFLVVPFARPLTAVLSIGSAGVAILSGWAAVRCLRLARRARTERIRTSFGNGRGAKGTRPVVAAGAIR